MLNITEMLSELTSIAGASSELISDRRTRLQTLLASIGDKDIQTNRRAFVGAVNAALAATRSRLLLPSGDWCKLKLTNPQGDPGFIQFVNVHGNCRSSLGRRSFIVSDATHIKPGRRPQAKRPVTNEACPSVD